MKTSFTNYPLRVYLEKYDGDPYWIAEFIDYPECKGSGKTRAEAITSADSALESLFLVLEEDHEELHEPTDYAAQKYNGRVTLRLSPYLHKRMALFAIENGISLNQSLSDAVAMFLGATQKHSTVIEKSCSKEAMLQAASTKYPIDKYTKTYVDSERIM